MDIEGNAILAYWATSIKWQNYRFAYMDADVRMRIGSKRRVIASESHI
ncbi:hypothetical protein PALB_3740 [Pseudoalteromonas luteoviolacea B = ATCC 29581]|nr:hypothetical protein PALB_3740 [Pseudoalteromonas luteoviolacea B = ATCC 29581]